jgi:diguanylate cyclase (GGDEF)-like protein
MKIHPIVGARILANAGFPQTVVSIVRSHHERWDGAGYPDRLRGEQIPLGARILAAADCLDALGTERDYRAAVSLDDAVAALAGLAGTQLDPRVVAALERRYRELKTSIQAHHSSTENSPAADLQSITAAREEVAGLFRLHEQLSGALSIGEVAHVLRTGLRELVPYDALAVYLSSAPDAKPDLVCGDRSVIRRSRPRITLPLPLAGQPNGRGRVEVFSLLAHRVNHDHLRLLHGLLPRIGQAIETGYKFAATSQSATTDFLTRLPNAQSLYGRLNRELEAAAAANPAAEVVVLMCDLDGFKQVNDTLGHLAGNRVLQEVAQALQHHTRDADYVARLGGDEFVLMLASGSGSPLEDRIARFRAVIRQAGKTACGQDWIDASFGAAVFPRDGDGADELLATADQRMYQEKSRHKKPSLPRPVLTDGSPATEARC